MSTDIRAKIRAILAKARDPGVTEAEAATFARKAAELLERHQLSEDQIRDEPVSEIVRVEYRPRYADPWRRSLVFATAALYMCRAINDTYYVRNTDGSVVLNRDGTPKTQKGFLFVGREHCTVVAEEMTTYLIDTVCRLAREHSSVRRERLAFERGCGEALAKRIHQLSSEQSRPAKPTPGDPLPALRATEIEMVNDWIAENMGLGKMRARGSSVGGIHSAVGAAAADGISLASQVSGGGSSRVLLE